jgi:hypothetical protein
VDLFGSTIDEIGDKLLVTERESRERSPRRIFPFGPTYSGFAATHRSKAEGGLGRYVQQTRGADGAINGEPLKMQ